MSGNLYAHRYASRIIKSIYIPMQSAEINYFKIWDF